MILTENILIICNLCKIQNEKILHKEEGFSKMKNKVTTVKELICEWQKVHCVNLAASTKLSYSRYIEKHIIPRIGEIKLKEIEQQDIQKIINHLSMMGRSAKTQKNMIGILHSIFEFALVNKKIDINPVKQVVTKKTAPYEYYIYSKEEYEKLLEVFRGSIDIIPVLLGGVCGLRLSEVFGLKWGDIDFEKNCLSIKRVAVDVNSKTDIKPTAKTAAGNRTISVPEDVLNIIKEYRAGESEWIYPSAIDPLQPANSHNFYQRYARKIKNAGLPHTRFHDLRHFAATQFLDAGVPDKYAAKYLGHADTNMTRKYQHIRQQVIPFPLGDTAPKVIIDTLPASVRSV